MPVSLAISRRAAQNKAMGDVSDQSLSTSEIALAAQQALEASGEQWTPLRASVFAALASFEAPASAYEVTEAVSSAQGRRVLANSVYRILDLFTAKNIVTRVESQNAFLVNAHPLHRHDCIFLVCENCGTTQHLDDDAAVEHVRAVAASAGFAVDRPVIELHGRCRDCQTR